ncbi:MAG: hydantoinase B/oxoprolinase family protein [Desulfobulbaceae bacterium]|nr:hydantoinase B/oxoprolinase family protein [Desulfobulbaceae bacterium]HIJ78304.1 5-oxoprolinase [Deltaproteobacteria bacterium]
MKREQGELGNKWSFWIDRGGTFTDLVARRPDGEIVTGKFLSENPAQYHDAALHGIRTMLGLSDRQAIDRSLLAEVKMGTTVGTNALLERRGEPVLLVTTKGFGDGLRIGYQSRPSLFALQIVLPRMLYHDVLEVDERVTARGEVLAAPDAAAVRAGLQKAFAAGLRAVAVVFMHGYRYPAHEQLVAALAAEVGFSQVSVSHGVSPHIKFVARGETTVLDAYLSPVLYRYVERLAVELGDTRLLFMKSDGGLTRARLFAGKDCLLSGPAGGVVGAVRTAELAGFKQIIGFDMGGTSTDVFHYRGELERAFEAEVAGVRLRSPMMDIHTVAAGGGSILHFDGSRYRVGPDSAGAAPGPAAYRQGGPLTVTDCNVVCGKILPRYFPALFGPAADQPLDYAGVLAKFAALATEIASATGELQSPEQVADGFLAIAVDAMANAIRKISTRRGHDLDRYTLTCFGGAGGQHACRVADALGIKTILLHPLSGVLSAYGMGLADLSAMAEQAVEKGLVASLAAELDESCALLADRACAELIGQGVARDRIVVSRKAQLRYQGSDTSLLVDYDSPRAMVASFAGEHQRQFGFVDQDKPLIVAALVVEAVGRTQEAPGIDQEPQPTQPLPPAALLETCRFFSNGRYHSAPVLQRKRMIPGNRVSGPAIIVEAHGTVVVEMGWRAAITGGLDLLLERVAVKAGPPLAATAKDPVRLEIFNNLYMAIAEQMGTVLAKTAHSVNIKERLDFSCAIFDCYGNLVANAPHVPVHLGSMAESVKAVIAARQGTMAPGDVYMTNAPYNGGSHLPDITVITPVFEQKGALLFYVASRGHHADIGGLTPGSMPPASVTVDEEGVMFDNFKLVDQGRFCEAQLRRMLTANPWPARNPEQNLADLKAQLGANEKGVAELRRMEQRYGLPVVQAYMQHVQDNAEEAVRRVIASLADGRAEYVMDNGARIAVKVTVDKQERTATIDFTGTSPQLGSNYNAPLAVCKAAVLYVFRCLVGDAIPLNSGCLVPLAIIVPEGTMLNPRYPAAVAAGNVETSQAVTDALFTALGAVACSQGTMNNFTFGDANFQYYETIAGGAGAGPGFAGASGVQSHMTNSRLTDPEVLEFRFPVLLESFALRQGSGGAGRYRGGEGLVRKIRFLQPMSAAIISNNRRQAPQGLMGGEAGRSGENYVERVGGARQALSYADQVEMGAGDCFVIKTPGGGGYGRPG